MEPAKEGFGRAALDHAWGSVGSGKYRVFARLGRGGMADVQLGVAQGPKGFSKLVVVKRLRPLLADDPGAIGMFLDEARVAARLNHPNLIQTYEFREEGDASFIVMEYLDGQSLHEVLTALRERESAARVPPVVWAKVFLGALAGLHYAHELRDYDGAPLHIVHRDVSPQNIVLTFEGQVKLVDFGIAKTAVNETQTESKVVKGKLAYMAPEQLDPRIGAIDRRADVFAMGIVLWECLARKRLFTGDAEVVMNAISDLVIAPPSSFDPAVPAELDAIVLKALARPRDARFQSAQEMRDALEDYLRATGEYVSEEDIGKLVGGLFADRRESMQQQIRSHMAMLDSIPPPPDDKKRGSAPPAPLAARVPEIIPFLPPITESAQSLRVVRRSVPAPRETRPWAIAAGALGLGLLVIVTAATLRLARPPPPAAAGASASIAPTAPVTSLHVELRAVPGDAVLHFDGAPVPNPFVGSFAHDAIDHRVEVTRDGYASVLRLVRFDGGDVAMTVALDPLPPAAPPSAPAPTPPSRRAPAAPAAPTSSPSAPAEPGPAMDIELQR